MVCDSPENMPKYAHVLIMLPRLLRCHVRLFVAPLLHPRQPAQLHQPLLGARLCTARSVLRFHGRQGRKVEEEGQSYGSRIGLSRRLGTFLHAIQASNMLVIHHFRNKRLTTCSGLLRCRSRIRRLQSRSPHTRRSHPAHLLCPLRSHTSRALQRHSRHGPQGRHRQISIL
jgi:hypothetical protein